MSHNSLKTNEIEEFLDIKISDFDYHYFKTYFSGYISLFEYLNNIELISYIVFNEKLKNNLKASLFKQIVYPIVLIVFAFITLITFKFSIIPMFAAFSDNSFLILINLFYYFSITLFVLSFLFTIIMIHVFRHPTYFILLYYRFYKFRFFKIIELYYICILSHLLAAFDKQGLSTFQTFELINKFKGNTIIANLAYFINSDLSEGVGLEKSILNMQINENFKRVLILGIKTNNYSKLLLQFNHKTVNDMNKEISYISKSLLFMSYFYIGIIVLLLYKILSLPIGLIDNL